MSKKRYTSEEVIHKPREVDVLPSQDKSIQESCRQIGVTDQTYFR